MGLDVYLQRNGKVVQLDSKIDPKHIFKVGYFRSSYNASGINSVLEQADCPNLYEIFTTPEGASTVKPDWQKALTYAKASLACFEHYLKTPAASVHVQFIPGKDGTVTNRKEALATYLSEASKDKPFASYSNRLGNFWLEGATLVAAMPGSTSWCNNGIYLVFKHEQPDGDDNYYVTALQIVIETIEYVLASDAPGEFSLAWSA